jgi:hypothetical protein
MAFYYAALSSDFTTTSTTATPVTGLFVPVSLVGQLLFFEFQLTIGSSSVAGLQFAFSMPPDASFRAWAVGSGALKSTLLVDLMQGVGSSSLGVSFNTVASTLNYLSIRGVCKAGSLGGSFQLLVAKTTSGTATVSAGSFVTADSSI